MSSRMPRPFSRSYARKNEVTPFNCKFGTGAPPPPLDPPLTITNNNPPTIRKSKIWILFFSGVTRPSWKLAPIWRWTASPPTQPLLCHCAPPPACRPPLPTPKPWMRHLSRFGNEMCSTENVAFFCSFNFYGHCYKKIGGGGGRRPHSGSATLFRHFWDLLEKIRVFRRWRGQNCALFCTVKKFRGGGARPSPPLSIRHWGPQDWEAEMRKGVFLVSARTPPSCTIF